ncbi:MAG: hypothetical protein D6717_08670 [Gammaproteobacteria bacterium]|nr:MAG: hypothetical protein D6717_08670 [Gammaproteobacteria bacterium]
MPYYVYRINEGPLEGMKLLEKVDEFESFKEAKTRARALRAELPEGENAQYKVMFAATELEAEEKLSEQREKPILAEWEK